MISFSGKRLAGIGVLIMALAILSGCSENGNHENQGGLNAGEDFDSTASYATGSLNLAGDVVKCPVAGASVRFYLLKGNGARGTKLGAKTTDTQGYFSIKFTPKPIKPILVEAWGGAYADEVSGDTVTLNSTDVMTAIVPVGTKFITVTPLTHLAATRARAMAGSGVPLKTAISAANAGVAQQYNLPDIAGVVPVCANNQTEVNTSNLDRRIYGLVLAGLSQLAHTLGVRTYDLISALALDLSDGILDGMNGTNPLDLPLIAGGTVRLPTSAGTSHLHNAIDAFLALANNKTHIIVLDIPNSPSPVGTSGGYFYIVSSALPVWLSGQFGSATISGQGGTLPYHCSLKGGSAMPAGFSISDACVISGTAEILAGGTKMRITPPFTVVMTDSAGSPASDEIELRITIVVEGPEVIPVPGACKQGNPCPIQVATATGGTPPYYFEQDTARNGWTPLGTVVGLDGYLTGTPSEHGSFTFGVCVVDLIGWMDCAQTTVDVSPDIRYSLTVNKTGTGTGTVGSTPSGISCGTDCFQKYSEGATVTLIAGPLKAFAGWSGACSGKGDCLLTMDSNKSVTARFVSCGSDGACVTNQDCSCYCFQANHTWLDGASGSQSNGGFCMDGHCYCCLAECSCDLSCASPYDCSCSSCGPENCSWDINLRCDAKDDVCLFGY